MPLLLGFSDASVPRSRRQGSASATLCEGFLGHRRETLAGPMRVTYHGFTTVASMEIVGMLLQLRMANNLFEATGNAGPAGATGPRVTLRGPGPRVTLRCNCDNMLAVRTATEETPESLRAMGAPHLVPMRALLLRQRDALILLGVEIEFWVPGRGRNSRGIRENDAVARGGSVQDEDLPAEIAAALGLVAAEIDAADHRERRVMLEQY